MKDFKKVLFYSFFTIVSLFSSFELYSMEGDGYSSEERKSEKRAEKPREPKASSVKKARTESRMTGNRPMPDLSGFERKSLDRDGFAVPSAPGRHNKTSPVSPMGRGMAVLGQVSPILKTPPKTTYSPEKSPVFKDFGPFTPMKQKRQPEHTFRKVMEYFVKNLFLFGEESDTLVQIVKILFEVECNQLKIKVELENIENYINQNYVCNENITLENLFQLFGDKNAELLKRVLAFYAIELFKESAIKHIHDFAGRKLFSDDAEEESDEESVSLGTNVMFSFSSGMDFDDKFSDSEDDHIKSSLAFIREIIKDPVKAFAIIINNNCYKNFVLGDQYDYFAHREIESSIDISRTQELLLNIISSKKNENYSFVQNFICRYLDLNLVLDESSISAFRNIFGCILNLLNENAKENCLLSYELKPLLITAKKVNASLNIVDPLVLDRFILIHDAHILNLVYEEKMLNSSQSHLAGGHFEDCIALNLSKSQNTLAFEITKREVLIENPVTQIKTVRFDISENDSLLGVTGKSKTSTVFPEFIKSNLYRYVLNWYHNNENVEVLNIKRETVRDNLIRETKLLRQNVGEDVYFVMVCFNEIISGCNVNTIWTVFPLGAFVRDWNAHLESLLEQDEDILPIPGVDNNPIKVSAFKDKIYSAVKGNTGGDNDSFYSFTKDSIEYILVKISDGIYIKFVKDNFDRIYPGIESEILEKQRQHQADKVAEASAKRKQKLVAKKAQRAAGSRKR